MVNSIINTQWRKLNAYDTYTNFEIVSCYFFYLVNSFQINIITYIFFMLPSMGLGLEASGYQNILGPLDPILGGENGVFLAAWAWKFSLFLFMVFRTALPIVMAKTDKALLAKINVIIR